MTTDELFVQIAKRGYGIPQKVIAAFEIPRVGWEMDNQGWVVWMENNTLRVFSTNHGSLCEMDRDELNTLHNDMLESAIAAKTAYDLTARLGPQYAYGLPKAPASPIDLSQPYSFEYIDETGKKHVIKETMSPFNTANT